jgi:hypothetical protein
MRELVTLPNGAVEYVELVVMTRVSLRDLRVFQPDFYAELLKTATDPGYAVPSPAREALMEASLLTKAGTIHESTRNIVLSGDDF